MRALKVADVMTRDVIVAAEDTPLKELAALLHEHRVSGVPVLDAEGRLVGIVTEADLLRTEEEVGRPRHRGSLVAWFLQPSRVAELAERGEEIRAADVMTPDVVTVTPKTTVAEAVRTLLEAKVKRLPVVGEDGRVAGIVSRYDLLGPLLRSDEELEREIEDEVVLGAMWIDPTTVDVEVTRGVVRLRGGVERRSEKEILVELIRRVDGVVGVEDELTFREDDRGIEPPPPREDRPLRSPFRPT